MPFALLYISRNRVSEDMQAQEVATILKSSLANNRAHSVTGALVGTPDYYAQVLEGPRDAVMRTMQWIEADPRHEDIRIVAREMIPQRSFAQWSLAHIGNSPELDGAIRNLAADPTPLPGKVKALWNLMEELAGQQTDPSRST